LPKIHFIGILCITLFLSIFLGSKLFSTRLDILYINLLLLFKDPEPIPVFDFPFGNPIYGIMFDYYDTLMGKSSSVIEKKCIIIVVTLNSCYTFIGNPPFHNVFKEYWDLSKLYKSRIELPKGDLTQNELKIFYKVHPVYSSFEFQTFSWKSDNSVCYRNFRPKDKISDFIIHPDILFTGYLSNTKNEENIIPISVFIDDEYMYEQYIDKIVVISLKTRSVEFCHEFIIGENLKSIQYESKSKVLWIISSKRLYKLSLHSDEIQNWREILRTHDYGGALYRAKEQGNSEYSICAGIYANKKFSEGSFTEAAQLFFQSNKSFDYVIIKFMEKLNCENAQKGLEGIFYMLIIRKNIWQCG